MLDNKKTRLQATIKAVRKKIDEGLVELIAPPGILGQKLMDFLEENSRPEKAILLDNVSKEQVQTISDSEKQENGTLFTWDGTFFKTTDVPESFWEKIISKFYDEHADLLFQLADQAIVKFSSYLSEDEVQNVVWSQKRSIARFIVEQLKNHFYQKTSGYEVKEARSFVEILDHNYYRSVGQELLHYSETVEPIKSIPSKLFTGFKRAYHPVYKFDSKTEKDFVSILETDNQSGILKWLRPAPNQFHIFWDHNSKRYEPDFVVETEKGFYLIETKKSGDIETDIVEQKAKAAKEYCQKASEIASKHWEYVLIPHNAVQLNMSFNGLVSRFSVNF
jgi:type III restriction enzyme